MNESDQVTQLYEWGVHNYEVATQLHNAVVTLLVIVGVLVVLLIALAAAYAAASQERHRLQEELKQQSDPEYQLALIRQLGEAGRREVRRLAVEAQHAMVMSGGQR